MNSNRNETGDDMGEAFEESSTRRLAKAEQDLGFLKTEVAGLKSDVGHVRADISNVKGSIDALANAVSQRGQTNWGVIAAGVGVLLSLIVYHSSLVTQPLTSRLDIHRETLDRIIERNEKRDQQIGREQQQLADLQRLLSYVLKRVDGHLNEKISVQAQVRDIKNQ